MNERRETRDEQFERLAEAARRLTISDDDVIRLTRDLIATGDKLPGDDALELWAVIWGVACERGPETELTDRLLDLCQAANAAAADGYASN